jgi:hypothetical protein
MLQGGVSLGGNAHQKSKWDTVTVITKQDDSYELHAAKGADLFALWNVLLMAAGYFD